MSIRANFAEVLCVLSWSEELQTLYNKALREWDAAGRPGHVLGSSDNRRLHGKTRKLR